jgi:toxin-antitoxin system PIN domain toxin
VKIVDLNILLYAVNANAPHHRRVRAWWEDALSGDEPVGLAWIVLLGFLRIATRGDIFPNALSPEDAALRVDAWLQRPNVRIVGESDDHWPQLRALIAETGTAGNLTSDAHLAAIAIRRGATLISCDNDFARFGGLQWKNPAAD